MSPPIPCANCGAPIPAHPWAAYCTLACLIEKEWAGGREVTDQDPPPAEPAKHQQGPNSYE